MVVSTTRVIAALALLALDLGGCREQRSPVPIKTTSLFDGGQPGDRDVRLDPERESGTAATGGDGAAGREPFTPREAPEAWAIWPMPNAPLPGLPNHQKYDTATVGVVVDQVTGLMWQRDVANTFMPFDDAQRECSRLKVAGHEDWRLPSRIELVSLLDMSRTQPSINLGAFPGAPSEWFWTSSVAEGQPSAAWYVYFYAGYPKTDEKGNRFSVRCVRDAEPRARPARHYDTRAGEVRDLATGLTWQRAAPDKTLALDAARAYCKQLTVAGRKGWRLPTEGELFTLVDEHAAIGPMIDGAAFPKTPSEPFWSSSFFAGGPAMAWYVAFDHGDGRYGFPTEKYRVRCVY